MHRFDAYAGFFVALVLSGPKVLRVPNDPKDSARRVMTNGIE